MFLATLETAPLWGTRVGPTMQSTLSYSGDYNSTATATMATAAVAQRYVEQLKALEQSGLDTAEAHAKYEGIVLQLNSIMPELNVTINEQTGLIDQNTQALLGDIEAWKKLAMQQALYEKMKGQLESYGEAQLNAAEAQVKLNEMTGFYEKDLQQLADTLGVTGAAYIETAKYAETGATGTGSLFYVFDKNGKKLAEFSATTKGVTSETMKLASSITKQQVTIGELKGELKSANDVIQEYEAEMDQLNDMIETNTNNTQENAEAQEKQQQAITQTQAALLELKEAYKVAKESTRAMLDSSIGLWDSVATKSEWTAKKVLENWRSQINAFNQYAANLQKAESMGLDDGIIGALSDGSEESMQILDALVNSTKYSIGEINAAFSDLDLAKDGTADMLVSMDESLRDGYDKLVEDARDAGVEIVDGIAQAIKDNAFKVEDAIESLHIAGGHSYEAEAEGLLGAMGSLPHLTQQGLAKQPQISNHYQFEVTQRPGESGEEFAYRMADIIANDAAWKGGGLGG